MKKITIHKDELFPHYDALPSNNNEGIEIDEITYREIMIQQNVFLKIQKKLEELYNENKKK